MTKIESKKSEIRATKEDVFNFLIDFNNYEVLMPSDKVEKWTSDSETCTFAIKGLAKIGMKQVSNTPYSHIEIVSNGKNPFDFKLKVELTDTNNPQTTNAQMVFEADINPFIKMMVSKPLTAFFDSLVTSLEKKYAV